MQGTAEENEVVVKTYQHSNTLVAYAHVLKAQVPSVRKLVELVFFDEFQAQKGDELQVY